MDVNQTRHPLASRTLAELQDVANKAEADHLPLQAADWTSFDWQILCQVVLTIRKVYGWTAYDIQQIKSTAEIPDNRNLA